MGLIPNTHITLLARDHSPLLTIGEPKALRSQVIYVKPCGWFPAFPHKCTCVHHGTYHRSESSVFPLFSSLQLRSIQEA